MAAPPALTRQADIQRAVRALQACGYEYVRVVVTRDGVLVEPMREAAVPSHSVPDFPKDLDNRQGPGRPQRVLIC